MRETQKIRFDVTNDQGEVEKCMMKLEKIIVGKNRWFTYVGRRTGPVGADGLRAKQFHWSEGKIVSTLKSKVDKEWDSLFASMGKEAKPDSKRESKSVSAIYVFNELVKAGVDRFAAAMMMADCITATEKTATDLSNDGQRYMKQIAELV